MAPRKGLQKIAIGRWAPVAAVALFALSAGAGATTLAPVPLGLGAPVPPVVPQHVADDAQASLPDAPETASLAPATHAAEATHAIPVSSLPSGGALSRPPVHAATRLPQPAPTRQEPAQQSPAEPAAAPPAGPVVKVQLEIVAKEIDVLGVPTEIWTYNGQVPGTIIRATEGSTIEVTIVNGHSQTHSLHTHLRGNLIASDGSSDTAPFPMVPHQHNPYPVQQNPIGPYDPRPDRDVADPGQSYTYTFTADTPGNFIYHCHVWLATDHIERGLFGMFVIYPKGWTWEEMPADELNGNTKARVTDDRGRTYFEDVVMMSELSPAAAPVTPPAAPAGAPITTEYPTAATTSGFTPAATGKIHLANYRAWNDPYLVGPVRPNERIILRVANIGDEMHDWHVHSHWFDVIDKTSRAKRPLFTDDTYLLGPGDSIETHLTAGNPGYWFMHDHIVPEAYTGMVPWLWVEGEPIPNVAPDVFVDNLVDGQVVAGNVPILGRADDFEGRERVKAVEVQIDGGGWTPVEGLLEWRYVWRTGALEDGAHAIAFRASDGTTNSPASTFTIQVRNQGLLAPAAARGTDGPGTLAPSADVSKDAPLAPALAGAALLLAVLSARRRIRVS